MGRGDPRRSGGGALLLFLAAGLMAESWLVPVAATTAAVLLRAFVVPREERALLEKFGESYGRYMERTGRFLPRRPVR